ncbi:MAG: aspartate kinase [Firmicutes bacterium]|nr:aspartate kinase [Bacillota bacterium]
MGIKVLKFGGSSLADAIQLQKVKNIVLSDPDRRYVVVSAPGKRYSDDNKITDLLYLCKTHIDHNIQADHVFQVICDRFRIMELNLGINIGIDKELEEIRSNLKPGVTADYIASRGEYLCGRLAAAVLGYDFVDPAGLIQFDEKGRHMEAATNEALAAALSQHERAVIPGFYGSNPDGSIRTFSRGGSDVTGSLVAKAVEAEIYENWTDVSGFLMADPNVVRNPKPIKNITYKELRELSYMGATVLHEDAVFPVREANIPINIKNTNEPENPGTIISDTPSEATDSIITGIAGRKDFVVIALYKNMMNSEIGFVKRLLTILENNDISFEHLPSGIDTVCIVISKKQLEGKLQDLLDDIEKRLKPDSVEIYQDMALIATVGLGMTRRLGVSAKLFTALNDAGVNVRMIDQGSSEMNIIIGVENDHFEAAIKSIYDAFVSE